MKRVVTSGYFDPLHVGHLECLELAKKLGDKLVVAINSDDSITRLKGNKRPINTLSQRIEVLSSLASVDWIISFEQDTPEHLIKEIWLNHQIIIN